MSKSFTMFSLHSSIVVSISPPVSQTEIAETTRGRMGSEVGDGFLVIVPSI
jgi:hypothetical protein